MTVGANFSPDTGAGHDTIAPSLFCAIALDTAATGSAPVSDFAGQLAFRP